MSLPSVGLPLISSSFLSLRNGLDLQIGIFFANRQINTVDATSPVISATLFMHPNAEKSAPPLP